MKLKKKIYFFLSFFGNKDEQQFSIFIQTKKFYFSFYRIDTFPFGFHYFLAHCKICGWKYENLKKFKVSDEMKC